jgi:hypothetical protein
MADNITVKDANGNDVVMRSTEQMLDEVTVVQVAHHIPEGEILEVLQKMAYILEDISGKLVLPSKVASFAGEIPVRLGSSLSGYSLPVSGSLTSAGTVSTLGNITTLGTTPGTAVGFSLGLLANEFERERILHT